MENLKYIADKFNVDGEIANISSFGSGHINNTYKVETKSKKTPDYILQAINNNVFKNITELSDNLIRITTHLRAKLGVYYSDKELKRRVLTIVYTKDKKAFLEDDKGNFWRMFTFIDNSKTIDKLENTEQAESMGFAYGNFQQMLSDLPKPPLNDVLPDFHNTAKRIEQFKETIANNPVNRLSEVMEEVDFLLMHEQEMMSIVEKAYRGIIPLRTVHQDTKLSNILFDEKNDKALCVIDLDTVMPGYLCYDFGDAIRGGMNTGAEDDEDLDLVSLNMDMFKSFALGYFSATKTFIDFEEIKTLAFGAKLITYEQSLRFLEDYINGDKYYSVHKPKHNLIRTRAQIALLKDIMLNFDEMENYVLALYS